MSSELIPAAPPIRDRGFSLEPDMLFGWRPPQHRKPPIELKYLVSFPSPRDPMKNEAYPLLYRGFRPKQAHEIPLYLEEATVSRQRPTSRQDQWRATQPQFDSHFECGNLDKVYCVGSNEYDLYLRPDTNTRGYMHWFYFAVEGVAVNSTLKFNIVNFTRSSPLYRSGMSVRYYAAATGKWLETREGLDFIPSKLKRGKRTYYKLTFQHTFAEAERVYFATSIPYTFSRLQNFLLEQQTLHNCVQVTPLCKSLSLLEVPLVTITSNQARRKKCIVVFARVHPAETTASWLTEGFIRFLTSSKKEAVSLRNRYIFKIVPMVNVDGVIVGNSRNCITGKDLNRFYNKAEGHDLLEAIVQTMDTLTEQVPAFMFFDMHSHFCKKGSFIYGPHFPMHNANYYKARVFARLIAERNEAFRFFSCRYKQERHKAGSARALFVKQYGVKHAFTVETSYYGYMNSTRVTHAFTEDSLLRLGAHIVQSIHEFHVLIRHEQKANKQASKRLKEVVRRIIDEDQLEHSDSSSDDSDTDEEADETFPMINVEKKVPSLKPPQFSIRFHTNNMGAPRYFGRTKTVLSSSSPKTLKVSRPFLKHLTSTSSRLKRLGAQTPQELGSHSFKSDSYFDAKARRPLLKLQHPRVR